MRAGNYERKINYTWPNCINKSNCPLNNKCRRNNFLYKANITSLTENCGNKVYYGISETKFKSQYANQKQKIHNGAELSNQIWKLKEQNKNVDILWKIP